jgi:hypothetical protein
VDPRADFEESAKNQERVTNFGPASFYFRMDVGQEQVDRFIHTSEEDKWKVLERAFGVEPGRWANPTARAAHRVMSYVGVLFNVFLIPVDLRLKDIEALYVADSIYENWVAIGVEKDPYKLTKLLGAQFADRVYGFEMMRVFTLALESAKVPFYLAATNIAFGRINIQDGYFGNAGKALEEYRRAANLENPELGHNIDLALEDFSANVLDENRVEIRFRAKAIPHVLYFRIDRAGFFHSTEKEIVVLNLGSFQVGENLIVLDKRGGGYARFLAEAFSEPSNYELFVGLGSRDRSWGPVANTKFFYKYPASAYPQ